MRVLVLILVSVFIVTGCASSHASRSAKLQCVPYARNLSGIEIYGNAHTWWDKATKQNYAKGKKPERGSVMVLAKTNKLKYGHVAVVKKVLSKRVIEVSHANWGKDFFGRGNIYESMKVKDISKNNDWSKVTFWSPESENYGYMYPTKGFVYNREPVRQAQAKASEKKS